MNKPFASIVIPSRNRPQALRECVTACLRLDYPADRFEVIVVDDGSEPPVCACCWDARVRVIRQSPGGPAAARNCGMASARGELLAFTDDDCRPRPDWLRNLADAWMESPATLLGGHTRNGYPANGFSTASQFMVDHLYEYYARDRGSARFFTSNNLAGSRDRIKAIGGFDPSFPLPAAEDRDLCDRWREKGGTLTYVPDAIVDHYHGMSLAGFLRQQFQYGRGAAVLRTKRSRRGVEYHVEVRYFSLGLLAAPFHRMGTVVATRTAALLFTAQICNVLGFVYQRIQARP